MTFRGFASSQRLFRFLATAAVTLGVLTFAQLAAAVGEASAASPALSVRSLATPTHFPTSDSTGTANYEIQIKNIGSAPTDGTAITITDQLPTGVNVAASSGIGSNLGLYGDALSGGVYPPESLCDPGPPVSCSTPSGPGTGTAAVLQPGEQLLMIIPLDVAPGTGPTAINHATASGGGAPSASDTETTPVSDTDAAFGFEHSSVSLTDANGGAVTQAGAHPYQFNTYFLLSSLFRPDTGTNVVNPPAGSLRDVQATLPQGLVVNPQATPVRCTEAQLETITSDSIPACPDASAVGLVHIPALGIIRGVPIFGFTEPLYNMVSPPGVPAELAFNVVEAPAPIHLLGGVNAAGDYQLTADASNLTQFATPAGIDLDLWGNPSDPSHNYRRGGCASPTSAPNGGTCPVPATDTPLLTMPSACSGPLQMGFSVDSYEDPGNFLNASPPTQDSSGNPVGVNGCSTLDFNPSLTAQPTTTQADSPTGLDVDLKVPQTNSLDEPATANLKKTVVDLPAGMAVNPSAADGLGACTPAQIGLTTPLGQSPAHFSKDPDTCPDNAKIGTVQITTPLLPDPLEGSVYLAQQDHNPFPNPSLLALYITIKDPQTGVVIKLPGQVTPDPQTGQLKASFDDTPELPFSDFALHFKSGNRATLVTPPSCGTYQTTSKLAPWSAADPNNPTPAETKTSTDSFAITTGPNGGPCPDYTDPAKFTPTFQAGTVSPQAGGYSPFVLKITRPDGQQSLKQIHIDMPPGLVAKLAGVPRCSQAQIIPGVGGSTNCPAGSQIGTVNVGAGAGNTPFFLQNQPVYLTDGYAGAPYGIAIDTHALAGPFDLGHVVIRSTLNVDPDDAQVHIDSEQIPNIIQGIPLHIRSIAVNVDKLGFILNPTNCNPMSVTGTVTGGGADFASPSDDTVKPVSTPFQVSGCGALGFSPHLSGTILNGAQGIHRSDHPNLQFNLGYSLGDANLASVGVLLPSSFQIDQANLGNICSETQLATQECAGRNPVGTASATTPILGSALSGPVYAVSGSGGLPKLAVILHGPPADPVKLLIRGITSTVGARILNTFPLVPDAPVSNFQLTLNGGPAGYLVNNTDVCVGAKGKSKKARKKASRLRRTNLTADANFTAQDGDTLTQSVPIAAQCPKAKKSKKASRRHH